MTNAELIARTRQNAAFLLKIASEDDWSLTDLTRIIANQSTQLADALERAEKRLAAYEPDEAECCRLSRELERAQKVVTAARLQFKPGRKLDRFSNALLQALREYDAGEAK